MILVESKETNELKVHSAMEIEKLKYLVIMAVTRVVSS